MRHQNIYNRLRRIEGQIRGIEEMLSKNRTEQEILIQLEAVKSSLSSTIANLLETMLEPNEQGKIVLEKEQAILLLHSIKKN